MGCEVCRLFNVDRPQQPGPPVWLVTNHPSVSTLRNQTAVNVHYSRQGQYQGHLICKDEDIEPSDAGIRPVKGQIHRGLSGYLGCMSSGEGGWGAHSHIGRGSRSLFSMPLPMLLGLYLVPHICWAMFCYSTISPARSHLHFILWDSPTRLPEQALSLWFRCLRLLNSWCYVSASPTPV